MVYRFKSYECFLVIVFAFCAWEVLAQRAVTEADLDKLLVKLKSPLSRSTVHEEAAGHLRQLGTNALPILLEKVKLVDQIGKTNRNAAHVLADELSAAFHVLGSNASPLFAELTAEFRAGRCLGNAPDALAQIGSDRAVRVIVEGLTNSNDTLKLSALGGLQTLKGNPFANQAVIPITLLLKEQTNSYVRGVAVNTLGALAALPDVSIPALLTTAESDSEPGVRAVAVKAIGRFGTAASIAKERLKRLAANDVELTVRREAERVLQGL